MKVLRPVYAAFETASFQCSSSGSFLYITLMRYAWSRVECSQWAFCPECHDGWLPIYMYSIHSYEYQMTYIVRLCTPSIYLDHHGLINKRVIRKQYTKCKER